MKRNKLLLLPSALFVLPILIGCNPGGNTPEEPTKVDFSLSENETKVKNGNSKTIKINLAEGVDLNKVNIIWSIKEESQSKIKEEGRTSDNLIFTFTTLDLTEESKPAELSVRIESKDKTIFKDATCFIDVVNELPKYTVTYKNIIYYDEETQEKQWEDYETQIVEYGTKLNKPTDPTTTFAPLYNFAGWYYDENWTKQYNFTEEEMIKADTTLYSCYARNDEKVVVFASPFEEYDYKLVKQGQTCPKPADPTKRGYNFKGWYLEDKVFDFDNTPITESIYLEGKSELIQYKVTYDYAGGELPQYETNPTTYNVNTVKTFLVRSKKDYYEFQKYVDESGNEITSIGGGEIGDLNLTAKYAPHNYTITYHGVTGLKNPNPTSFNIESSTITLQGVDRLGYFFDTWCTDEALENPISEIKPSETLKNIDLYVKWKDYYNFTSCDWSFISAAATQLEEGAIEEAAFAGSFADNQGKVFTSGKSMVGSLRTVNVNGQPHQVRVIGFNYDVDSDGDKLALTFEFVNLISDQYGYSISWQWQDVNEDSHMNENYTNSSIRKALCKSGEFSKKVYAAVYNIRGGWSSEFTDVTVFSMLDRNIQDLLKPVKKKVAEGSKFEFNEYKDKLFMLSISEMGVTFDQKEQFRAYDYYQGKKIVDCGVKKQVKNEKIYTFANEIPSTGGQQCASTIWANPGHNAALDNTGGGPYWLRSPETSGESANHFSSYYIPSSKAKIEEQVKQYARLGYGLIQKVNINACGIAPAFCM